MTVPTALDVGLARVPDVAARLDVLHATAWQSVDAVVLELCRLRMATLLGLEAEQNERTPTAVAAGLVEAKALDVAQWPTSPQFSNVERACLAFAEWFVIDVASIPDEMALNVVEHLGDEGARTFVTALLVVEQRQRLSLAWERLLGGDQ